VQERLKQLLNWIAKSFRDPYKQEIERYLSESIDAADLERRMRIVENRGML
jgi:hypothetical protein